MCFQGGFDKLFRDWAKGRDESFARESVSEPFEDSAEAFEAEERGDANRPQQKAKEKLGVS